MLVWPPQVGGQGVNRLEIVTDKPRGLPGTKRTV